MSVNRIPHPLDITSYISNIAENHSRVVYTHTHTYIKIYIQFMMRGLVYFFAPFQYRPFGERRGGPRQRDLALQEEDRQDQQ